MTNKRNTPLHNSTLHYLPNVSVMQSIFDRESYLILLLADFHVRVAISYELTLPSPHPSLQTLILKCHTIRGANVTAEK